MEMDGRKVCVGDEWMEDVNEVRWMNRNDRQADRHVCWGGGRQIYG